MRVSLKRADPAFDPNANFDVYLNGAPVNCVVTADEEAGEVICNLIGEDGYYVIDGNEFVEAQYTGHVEINGRH